MVSYVGFGRKLTKSLLQHEISHSKCIAFTNGVMRVCVSSLVFCFHQILTLCNVLWRGVAPPAKMYGTIGTTSKMWCVLLHILIVALLLLQLSYSIYDKAILSSSGCHVCFPFHDLPYQVVHPRTPLRFCRVHVPRKIRSIAFSLMVSSTGRASFTAVYCMNEVCSVVGSILGNIHHQPLNPLGCTKPSSNFSLWNSPT